jgi:hypothetical protein
LRPWIVPIRHVNKPRDDRDPQKISNPDGRSQPIIHLSRNHLMLSIVFHVALESPPHCFSQSGE